MRYTCGMKSKETKNLSAFAQSAFDLDSDFTQLERLSTQLEELSVESDYGLEQGKKLLLNFNECAQRIGDRVQALAQNLGESRERAEAAAAKVSERAQVIHQRHNEQEKLLARFQSLGEMVRKATDASAKLKKPDGGKLTEEDKMVLEERLPEIDSQLQVLIQESHQLREEARATKMKTLEKNAESLGQSLNAVRNRLNLFMGKSALTQNQTH